MSLQVVCVAVLVVVGLVQTGLACNGYKAVLKKVENCAGSDGVIQIDPGFSIKLNKNCELVPTGCISSKAFGAAKGRFALKKDGFVMKEGKVDLCAAASSADGDAKGFMKVFAVPESCPVNEGQICANGQKADISKYKNMLSMAKGSFLIDATIDHDTGSSCFHVEMDITK